LTKTVEEFRSLFNAVSNWGRWGFGDTLGTLNLVTTETTRRAVALVQTGQAVGCSRPVGLRKTTMPADNLLHLMSKSGEDSPDSGEGAATDWVGVGLHGFSFTHLDAHSHVFWDGKMYNGRDKALVTTERGALAGGLEPTFNGIVTRGVLVDGPELLGVSVLAAGTVLQPNDLKAWFERTGVLPEPGDVLFVRTGFGEQSLGTDERPTSGLSARCMPMLRDADIAVLASDGVNDAQPSGFEPVQAPVHLLGLVSMGLWIIDNASLSELARTCHREGRYEFLTMIAPVPFRRATGSLVNPIAVI
jgi:kynurenine formamidase